GSSNSGFLDSLYYDLLNRPIDSTSRNTDLSFLGLGGTRADLAGIILASTEYRSILIERYYQRFLHHAADNTGQTTFQNYLSSGGTDEGLIGFLAGSTEYYNVRSGGTVAGQYSVLVTNVPPALTNLSITSPL